MSLPSNCLLIMTALKVGTWDPFIIHVDILSISAYRMKPAKEDLGFWNLKYAFSLQVSPVSKLSAHFLSCFPLSFLILPDIYCYMVFTYMIRSDYRGYFKAFPWILGVCVREACGARDSHDMSKIACLC